MARYRSIYMGTWSDSRFRQLSSPAPNAQFLWFFLLTGKYTTNIPGCILATPDEIAATLRWTDAYGEGFGKAFREAFAEVIELGMAKVDDTDPQAGFIWLPNGPKRNRPQSVNVVIGWGKVWDEVPDCALKAQAWEELRAYVEGLPKGYREAFAKACPKPSLIQRQKQRQKQEQREVSRDEPRASASPPSKPKVKSQPPGSDHQRFIAEFTALFERHRGVKPEWGKKQGAMVKTLLGKPGGLADAIARAERMFELAPRFPAENPDLPTLVSHWDKFAPKAKGSSRGRAEPAPHSAFAFGEQPL
jgi:hypothetical protein